MNDALVGPAEHVFGHLGGPAGAVGEEGEDAGDKGPDPGLGVAFLGRRFINVEHRLIRELFGQLVISRLDGLGRAILEIDHPGWTGRLVENQAEELCLPTIGLAETSHEQGHESNQTWPGLAGRDALRQFPTG